MPTIRTLVVLLAALLPSAQALAEGDCPPGFYRNSSPGHVGDCIPIPTMPEQVSGPKWRTTWGAIAAEPGSGRVGVAVGKDTKFAANRTAMKACQSGGRDCKIVLSYNHQCAAIAEIPDAEGGRGAKRGYATGPDQMTSAHEAMSACQDANPGATCKIAYSDCSKPVYVP